MSTILTCHACGRPMAPQRLWRIGRRLLCPACWQAWLDANAEHDDPGPRAA